MKSLIEEFKILIFPTYLPDEPLYSWASGGFYDLLNTK